jgi:hypothetical protein
MEDDRIHVIVDASEIVAGDVMFSWDPTDPFGPWTVKAVDKRPSGGMRGNDITWHVDLDYGTHKTYNAEGPRKISPRMAS